APHLWGSLVLEPGAKFATLLSLRGTCHLVGGVGLLRVCGSLGRWSARCSAHWLPTAAQDTTQPQCHAHQLKSHGRSPHWVPVNALHSRRCCSRSRVSARAVPSSPSSANRRSTSPLSRRPLGQPLRAPRRFLRR